MNTIKTFRNGGGGGGGGSGGGGGIFPRLVEVLSLSEKVLCCITLFV